MPSFVYTMSSVKGHSHKINNMPNQDAIKLVKSKDALMIAISDGHGASYCVRSDIGAKMAVDITCDQFKKLEADLNKLLSNNVIDVKDNYYSSIEKLARKSLLDIDKQWKSAVNSHILNNPFTTEEMKIIDKNRLIAYGATIMSVIVVHNIVIFFNIGDGTLLLAKNENQKKDVLLNNDMELVRGSSAIANETESLSMNDAYKHGQVSIYQQKELKAFMMSTDGYINSFKHEEGFLKVLSDLIEIKKQNGIELISKDLPQWLEQTSENGSGDDITTFALFFTDTAKKFPKF